MKIDPEKVCQRLLDLRPDEGVFRHLWPPSRLKPSSIQANAEGGLSERARRRALEIADDADLRIRAPRNFLKGAQLIVSSLMSLTCSHMSHSPSPDSQVDSALRESEAQVGGGEEIGDCADGVIERRIVIGHGRSPVSRPFTTISALRSTRCLVGFG
jgi:hypothetical protein